jgi:hypothetical protein
VASDDSASFDRYKQASIAHQMLQAARAAGGDVTEESEAELAVSARNLDLARVDYLRG